MAGDVSSPIAEVRDNDGREPGSVSSRRNGFAEYQISGTYAAVPGEENRASARRHAPAHEVVLLLIGPGDAPRSTPTDWLSQELRAAPRSPRPVLPILLKGADSELQVGRTSSTRCWSTQALRLSRAAEDRRDQAGWSPALRRFGAAATGGTSIVVRAARLQPHDGRRGIAASSSPRTPTAASSC